MNNSSGGGWSYPFSLANYVPALCGSTDAAGASGIAYGATAYGATNATGASGATSTGSVTGSAASNASTTGATDPPFIALNYIVRAL